MKIVCVKRRPDVGGHDAGFISPQRRMLLVSLRKLGPLGSGFGGSAVLILPQDIHAFIIYSFIQQKFLELSLGTRFCVELWW